MMRSSPGFIGMRNALVRMNRVSSVSAFKRDMRLRCQHLESAGKVNQANSSSWCSDHASKLLASELELFPYNDAHGR